MKKKFRDTLIALAALTALLVMMVSMNPLVRQRAGALTNGITNQQLESGSTVVGQIVGSIISATSGYAVDNTYLFAFLVAACLLFVAMLRT
jgi:hypothetical protein